MPFNDKFVPKKLPDIICIVPARGGSKRLPGKNLKPLNGKPLVAYTLENALHSGVFSKVILSTDDPGIGKIGGDLGVEVDHRPPAMAEDHISTIDVLVEYMNRAHSWEKYTGLAVMLPTCPFRSLADTKNAVSLFLERKMEAPLVSVTEYDFSVNLALKEVGAGVAKMHSPGSYIKFQSQDQETMYHPNGGIYLSATDRLKVSNTFFEERILIYKMPPVRSLDIDYPYQFAMAEALLKTSPELFED